MSLSFLSFEIMRLMTMRGSTGQSVAGWHCSSHWCRPSIVVPLCPVPMLGCLSLSLCSLCYHCWCISTHFCEHADPSQSQFVRSICSLIWPIHCQGLWLFTVIHDTSLMTFVVLLGFSFIVYHLCFSHGCSL